MDYEELIELAQKAIEGGEQDRLTYEAAYESYRGEKLCMDKHPLIGGGPCIQAKGSKHTHKNADGLSWS